MAKTCQYWGKNKQTQDAHYDDQDDDDDDDDDTNHFKLPQYEDYI